MSTVAPAIVIVPAKTADGAYYEAKWRDSAGRQVKRRLGQAWMERDPRSGEWRKRRGRTPAGWLDPRTVHVAAAETVEEVEREQAEAARAAALGELVTFRRLTEEWLTWKRDVKGAAPATLRDNRSLLCEPGQPHKRGRGVTRGRIMERFGDRPVAEITTREMSRFLSDLDAEGMPAPNVNKYRALLHAIVNYAMRPDTYGDQVTVNPVSGTDKRFQPPPAPLDHYERQEIEALVRVCEQGKHRAPKHYKGHSVAESPDELAACAAEDQQDAAAFALMFFSGLRLGELLALRWRHVRFLPDLSGVIVTVEKAVSAGVEKAPKSGRTHDVPVARPAAEALADSATSSLHRMTTWCATASANASMARRCADATSARPELPACARSSCTAFGTRPGRCSRATTSTSSRSATSTGTRTSRRRIATSAPSSTWAPWPR
jgi:integrase